MHHDRNLDIENLEAQTGKNRDKPHPQNTSGGRKKFRHWRYDKRNEHPSQRIH